MGYKIIIEGERYDIDDVRRISRGVAEIADRDRTFIVAESEEEAGAYASLRWREMAQNDPDEFVALIGTERLVQWAMGHCDNYGFQCLDDFLEAVENCPAEELASYDGIELVVMTRGLPDDDLTVCSDF